MANLETVARLVLTGWFAFLGGAVGSFLNVVIYRVPAGLNIAWPGSHCPKCKHAIRWYDNLPVVGWLMLNGRCRDCHNTISPRYPLVEGFTASLFLLIAWVELLRHDLGFLFTAEQADVSSLVVPRFIMCLLHCGLIATLLAMTVIIADGNNVKRVAWPISIVGILLIIWWPELHPLPAWPSLIGNDYRGPIDVTCGLAVALLIAYPVGQLVSKLSAGHSGRPRSNAGFVQAILCVGIVLGWQAAAIAIPISALVDWLLTSIAPTLWQKRGSSVAILALLTLAWILGWASLVRLGPLQ